MFSYFNISSNIFVHFHIFVKLFYIFQRCEDRQSLQKGLVKSENLYLSILWRTQMDRNLNFISIMIESDVVYTQNVFLLV